MADRAAGLAVVAFMRDSGSILADTVNPCVGVQLQPYSLWK